MSEERVLVNGTDNTTANNVIQAAKDLIIAAAEMTAETGNSHLEFNAELSNGLSIRVISDIFNEGVRIVIGSAIPGGDE